MLTERELCDKREKRQEARRVRRQSYRRAAADYLKTRHINQSPAVPVDGPTSYPSLAPKAKPSFLAKAKHWLSNTFRRGA